MKVLFVSSGNSKIGISPIIKNQGESLIKQDIELEYYTIKGKGLKGYINNIKPLRLFLKDNKFDIVHVHYSLSAFVASLAGAKPLVVSLMGSDVKANSQYKLLIKLFNYFCWSKVIVKSEDMKASLGLNNVAIIPNGVDFSKFKSINQIDCKKVLTWDTTKKQILFAASINRYEKNYQLAQDAVNILNNSNVELKYLDNIPNSMMPTYHNAADVVILTSLWEGSPNVIKEAMACNRPIVSTDVGDVKTLFKHGENLLLSDFNPKELALKLELMLKQKKSNGRYRLLFLKLDSTDIAKRIIDIYYSLIN